MSQHNPQHPDMPHADAQREPDPADSRADAVAALAMITIAVCGILFYISQQ